MFVLFHVVCLILTLWQIETNFKNFFYLKLKCDDNVAK